MNINQGSWQNNDRGATAIWIIVDYNKHAVIHIIVLKVHYIWLIFVSLYSLLCLIHFLYSVNISNFPDICVRVLSSLLKLVNNVTPAMLVILRQTHPSTLCFTFSPQVAILHMCQFHLLLFPFLRICFCSDCGLHGFQWWVYMIHGSYVSYFLSSIVYKIIELYTCASNLYFLEIATSILS